MNDTLLLLPSTMSNDHHHERIHEIKSHINQLLCELRLIEPNSSYLEYFQPFNITINTQITNGKCLIENAGPYLSRKQVILHSTTYNQYKKENQRKNILITSSPTKMFFAAGSACATSTPKHSPTLHKPHYTSTPRRNKRHSTIQPPNLISLKRLLYKNNNRHRHSAVPVSKRSILPRYSPLYPVDENPQWI